MKYSRILKEYWGYDSFRGIQREIIESIGAGRDTLGLMPTGGGKSITFQVPALASDGLCVVITPLIALMKDQVANLRSRGIKATAIYSGMRAKDVVSALENCIFGDYKFLYVSPERLSSELFLLKIRKVNVSLITVDEAHCISQWGHDFRPDYLRLGRVRQELGYPQTVALTATATPRVQQDLGAAFSIAPEHRIILPPYRGNITRICRPVADRMPALLEFLGSGQQLPAIVYCRTRKETEWLAGELATRGYLAAHYHAGLPADQRELLQDAFLRNEITVLVATIAFGMGIDKPDVRAVVHWSTPSSPESYLQESGRAGRDSAPCTSLILLHAPDLVEARNRILAAEPDAEGVLRCVRWLLPAGQRVVSLWELGTTCDVPDDVPTRALMALEGSIVVESKGSKYYC